MLNISKSGNSVYVLFGARNYASGATVTMAVYNDANTAIAGSPFTMSEISGTGLYGATFTPSTTGQFKIQVLEGIKKSAHAEIKISTHDIESVGGDVVTIKGILENVTYGNSALNDKLVAIEGSGFVTSDDSLVAIKDYLVNTIQSSISGISNNTNVSVAIPTQMTRPASSYIDYKVYVNTYASNGDLQDPMDQDPDETKTAYVAVDVANASGASRVTNLQNLSTSTWESLKWMTRESIGRFSLTYRVPSTHAHEELIFSFAYHQGGVAEITEITTEADVSSSLNNKYWWVFLPDRSVYVWYNVGSAGVDPNPSAPSGGPATTVGLMVNLSANMTANQVATQTQTIIDAYSSLAATVLNNVVTVTVPAPGAEKDAMDGNTGWTAAWNVTQQGVDGAHRLTDRSSTVSDIVDISTDVTTIKNEVQSSTYGLSALKSLIDGYLANGGSIETRFDTLDTATTNTYNIVSSGTYGLAALKGLIDTLQLDMTAVKGSGFSTSVDSLKAQSDRQQAIQGAGWSASTDTLHQIASAISGIDVGNGGYIG